MTPGDELIDRKPYKSPQVIDYGDIHEITQTTSNTAGGPDGGTGTNNKTAAP